MDVDSQEIAFPGQKTQFPGLDQDSWFHPSVYLLLVWLELDRRQECKGGRGDRQPVPDTIPGRCPDPIALRTIDIAGSGVPKTSKNGWGSTTREAQWLLAQGQRAEKSQ